MSVNDQCQMVDILEREQEKMKREKARIDLMLILVDEKIETLRKEIRVFLRRETPHKMNENNQ